MKIVVKMVPKVPSTDMGARAANDFKLQSGTSVVVVTPKIQNCRVVIMAGKMLPEDWASEERKSPITSK